MGFCLKLTGMLLAALVAIGAGFYFNFEHALSSGLPIPGAPAAFPFGNVLEIVKDPNFLVGLETLTKTHADKASGLASIWQFSTQVISATDPDDIQAILATPTRTDPPHVTKLFGHTIGRRSLPVASDADWPTLRTVVHRAVRKIHLPRFVPEVFQAVDALAHKLTTSGRQLDAAVYLRGMVYDLVGRYAYNTPITGVNDGLQAAVDFLYRENIRRTTSPNPIDGHFWIPTDLNVRLNEARDKFRSSIQQEIRARRQGSSSDPNHEDFLKYLLEEDSLDEETLIDTVSSMVFGSTETFVSLLTYAVYVTGSEPEIQARIYEEAKSAFTDPAAFKVGSLPYTNRVLKETLRLYPPAPLTQRTVPASGGRPPILLNGTVAVPAGTSVWVPIWAAHRREETFPDPLRFDPSRFEADEAPRGYLPFGAGPRNCVAAAFAEGLGTVILARLVYGAEFTTVGPSTPQAFGNGFVQFALHGVPLIAKERV